MTIHELKTETNYFHDICYNGKTFEVRKNDRNYKKGDMLLLKNYNPKEKTYEYGYVMAKITYILEGGNFGIDKEMVVMGIQIVSKEY